ncbi:MAG: lipoprotein-releasing ABC transporter permease subunit [Caulobacteraceae bacterium]|nr:lipoprotein-releasing ABC transporter permease subunit [Caulobacteraceae bacterium]
MTPPSVARAPPFSAWEREIAVRYLRARRVDGGLALIAVISFVGTTLAVMALIVVMAIMNGFRADLTRLILGFNGHAYVVGADTGPGLEASLGRIRAVPGVVQAFPVLESETLVQSQSSAAGAVTRAVRPEDLRATPLIAHNIKRGSMAGFGKGEDGGDQVLIGMRLAQSLGVEPGDTITLTSPSSVATAMGAIPTQKSYVVGGVFEVGMSEYDQTFLYMPLQQAELFFGRSSADFVEVKLADPEKAPAFKDRLAAAAGPGATVTDWTEKNRDYFGALQVEHNAMGMTMGLLVVIAGLLILSALVMLVKNKGHDIAILMTMGASRGAILRIFLMCGLILGSVGALCGLIGGVLFCWNIGAIQSFVEWATHAQVFNPSIYFLTRVPAKIVWSEVALTIGFSVCVALAAAVVPAWFASRLDPVEALRYE